LASKPISIQNIQKKIKGFDKSTWKEYARIVYFGVLNIKGIHIPGKSVLAPMAGITDKTFRQIVKSMGVSLVFTELISSDGLVRDSTKTFQMLQFRPEERPIGIQLFGNDPEIMARGAQIAESAGFDSIDLNFGCPAKKVVKKGAGAALLNNLRRLKDITRAVVQATSIPVSGKIRIGWTEKNLVAVEVSRILEQEGVCWVTVHGRTKQMGFKGQADWNSIRSVKEAVSIPIIGNGDVKSPEDAKCMIDETGCDMVMVGRGALGKPWLFKQIDRYLEMGELGEPPSYRERIELCLSHYQLALKNLGVERGVREMRKHIGWYIKGLPDSSRIRTSVFTMTEPDYVKKILQDYAKSLE